MSRSTSCLIVLVAFMSLLLMPVFADGPTFRADYVFKGSSLATWTTMGPADWKAQNGEITGTPKQPEGGWLLLKRSFQNVAFYANIHCAAGCKTGVLLRAEKTQDGGLKGVYVSFTEGDLGYYAVTLDAQGKETNREKLNGISTETGPGGNFIMGALIGASPAVLAGLAPVPPPPGVKIPEEIKPPSGSYNPGQWNNLDINLYGDNVTGRQNGGMMGNRATAAGEAKPEFGNYGPIALYVGGTGEAQFKDVETKDLNSLDTPKETVSPNFRMQRLNPLYYSWSAQVADVNHDGIPDVIAGPYYYLGPNYTEAHEIYDPSPFNPAIDYALKSMVSLAYDFTGDGWPDVLVMSGNAGIGVGTLYVNPKGESRHWDHFVVLPHVGNEETLLKDIDGDGKLEVIFACNNALCYAKPDPANPTGLWKTTQITEQGPWGVGIGHGIGVGDINGDGRVDLLSSYGWWEQPAKGSSEKYWKYHPFEFGRWGQYQGGAGGAEIGVYDVNGDGLNDVVTALEGHGFGLAWYEQKRDAKGNITFVEHTIMDNFLTKNAGDVIFTEPHAMGFADIDGDGIPDFVTGKRVFSHLYTYSDPDPLGPAVLYVYHTVRDPKAPGGARFVPELIHNMSGVGSHFAIADLKGDGKSDIVTSGAYGTFIFFNEEKKVPAHAKR